MDIPMSKEEMKKLNIDQLDVILITGDAFVDHPSFGVAIIARVLKEICGLSVGVISQPDWKSEKDITRLGIPKYFFGVTGGNLDSMVSNYTASKKKRKEDAYSPDKLFRPRPDRATIVYSNLLKKYFKNIPIILGGIEASLRRMAHYDWWQNKVKNSILLDSKADILVYGMGEKTIIQIANNFKKGFGIDECKKLRGVVYQSSDVSELKDFIEMPSLESVSENKLKYLEAFNILHKNNDPLNSRGLIQKHLNRYVIQNKPQFSLLEKEMDEVYALNYTKKVHPYDLKKGYVKSLETVKNSITSHRGCYGECSFCALTLHQGRTIQTRSEKSIINEIIKLTKDKDFNGYISDIGGPTANMYGFECKLKLEIGACKDKNCIGEKVCPNLKINHKRYIDLLKKVSNLDKVKKIFISSGIRLDLIYNDKKYSEEFLEILLKNHTPGRIKIAPEHTEDEILKIMSKPSFNYTEKFIDDLNKFNKKNNQKKDFSAYLIVGHPGEKFENIEKMKKRLKNSKEFKVENVQIFTPTPSTKSTSMYYTEMDFASHKNIEVLKDEKRRSYIKNFLIK